MTMSRRAKILILIALLVLIVLVILAIILGRRQGARRQGDMASPAQTSSPGIPLLPAPQPRGPLGAVAPHEQGERARSDVIAYARSFTERFGSYSNQSDFENLESLYPFMTARLRRETESYVAAQRSLGATVAPSYNGITTSVINVATLAQNPTDMQFKLTTQRRQSGGNLRAPQVYYQPIEMTVVKEGEAWKVDRAEWK